MLSVNPDLSWTQVREIIKDTSDKIDRVNGKYNAQGHSSLYGYGRVDAEKAVKKAIELKISLPAKKVRNNRSAGLKRNSVSVKTGRSKKIII
jgi:hypothetical protein